ncbi:MAG: zinc finger domain-containing protein [Opitutaceae bacterium]
MLACSLEDFSAALTRRNHTVKRALTDPHVFSGIGNAYSDEILHAAGISPVALTQKLTGEEVARIHKATTTVLAAWIDCLRAGNGGGFPEKVTAFHPAMAVHGKFGRSCPVCGTLVQRIRYAENEVNYCPRCQTGGRVLADRSLSRLLKQDWPRTVEEAEALQRPNSGTGAGRGAAVTGPRPGAGGAARAEARTRAARRST